MPYGSINPPHIHARINSRPGLGTGGRRHVPRYVVAGSGAVKTLPGGAGGETGNGTILVVEDDEVVRELVVQVLEDDGFAVLQAADARSALRIIESPVAIRLLVTDVGLPGMNGRQLAEISRTHRPKLKILFTTGYAQNAELDGIAGLEDIGVMGKPFQLDLLVAKVRAMIGT